jgi:hypothetical protein
MPSTALSLFECIGSSVLFFNHQSIACLVEIEVSGHASGLNR